MSRHAPDDFSFLPTVDSTDEEDVAKEPLWKSKPDPAPPEAMEHEHEPVAESFPVEETGYEESGHEEAEYEELIPEEVMEAPLEPPIFVQEPQPAESGHEFESEASPPVEEVLDESLLAKAHPPAILPKLAAITPPVEEKQTEPLPRADTPPEKPKGDAESVIGKKLKPFVAPKPAPEEPLDPDEAKKLRWKKLADKVGLRTLGMSFGVHMFLLLIATFVGVSQVMDQQVDFLPGGSSAQSQAAAEALTHKVQNKKNPWLKAKPQQRKVTVQSITADIVLPEMPPMDMMDFSKINSRMDLSKAPSMAPSQPVGLGGAGGGFGAGIGRGGKFNFVGQTAVGSKVIFVVDISSSMSQRLKGDNQNMTRFALMKKELSKAVKQIPVGAAYQILYFSDFAFAHNQVDTRDEAALERYRWDVKPDDYKQVKLPSFKYIQATPFTLQDSVDIIQRSENPGIYTNWGSGLLMALNANPKPDVIFFMTDGERKDEMGWIDIVTAENKRKLPMTVIHTSVMAQTDADHEMDSLAKRNNGSFTVVTDDGQVIKGEDHFKMK